MKRVFDPYDFAYFILLMIFLAGMSVAILIATLPTDDPKPKKSLNTDRKGRKIIDHNRSDSGQY